MRAGVVRAARVSQRVVGAFRKLAEMPDAFSRHVRDAKLSERRGECLVGPPPANVCNAARPSAAQGQFALGANSRLGSPAPARSVISAVIWISVITGISIIARISTVVPAVIVPPMVPAVIVPPVAPMVSVVTPMAAVVDRYARVGFLDSGANS